LFHEKEIEEDETGTKRERLADLTPEKRELIEWVEQGRGKKLTEEEINLALDQARHIGEV
jgi:hypothetical protein